MRIKNLNRAYVDAAVASFADNLAPSCCVADIGAGSGHYRRAFASQRYVAVDRGYEQGSHAGLDAVGDILALPLAGESMDAAICVEVLEHVRDPHALLTEIHRVVKQGGHVLLTSPLCYGEHMQPYDYYRFTRYALTSMAEGCGFSILRIEPRGGFFVLVAYLLARFPDELARGVPGKRLQKLVRLLSRFLTTYSLAPLVAALDRFDKRKSFTLGYICTLVRQPGPRCR